jgi:serine/threonine protein phosphatase PrpC
MPSITMSVAGLSDVGRVRAINEDSFVIATIDPSSALVASGHPVEVGMQPVLLAVSDGMGGHNAGEVASGLTLDALLASLRDRGSTSNEVATWLQAAAAAANAAVRMAGKTRGREGMGATLTAGLSIGGTLYIGEVGDSRAYLVRERRLRQLTRDQSLVQALVDSGAMTAEAAKTSPRKNVILQAIGIQDRVDLVVTKLELRRGDRILICCDGVSNTLTDDELTAALVENAPLAGCDRLIALANEQGGRDNLTAIVAHYDGDGLSR